MTQKAAPEKKKKSLLLLKKDRRWERHYWEKMPREEITEGSIGKCLFFPSIQGQMKESMPSQEMPVTGLFMY